MEISVLLKGLLAGLTIAAPLGPVNLICIQRTLSRGSRNGLISGLGAATADTIYGIIAGFGLTLVSNFLINHEDILRIAGGAFIIILGARVFFYHSRRKRIDAENVGLLKEFTSTFILTLTNPITIIAFLGIFAALGLTTKDINYGRASILVCGVFLGSVIWWSILSSGVDHFKERFTDKTLHHINQTSGVVITLFGVFLILSYLFHIKF